MATIVKGRNGRGLLLGSVCALLAGCGLSDYEKRIDEQKEFLARFDEESKLLGDALLLPERIGKDKLGKPMKQPATKLEFFLRPPKGIQPAIKGDEGIISFEKVTLFRYAGAPGNNVLIAVNPLKNPNVKAPPPNPKGEELTPEEFQDQVRDALAAYYAQVYMRAIDWSQAKKLDKELLQVQDKGALVNVTFETQTLTDKPEDVTDPKEAAKYSLFRIYFRQQGKDQGAVIYQFPADKARDQQTTDTLKFSVPTFNIGDAAKARRQEYFDRRR